ncbi:MAG: DUF6677 family protein [Acidobacteriota bacterium]
MAAKSIEETAKVETPRVAWLMGLAAWAVPGLGHVLQRKFVRAVLLGGAVWAMFFIGLGLGGHLYTVTDHGLGALVQLLPMSANVGTGLLYLACWLTNSGFAEQAHRVTYEYGNTFLLVAGLLNYLTALDAFDIAAGRKQ